MKTAEEFRRALGETEASFQRCVRQTLTELECKEEKPVKKMSMSLALACVILLLTMTAFAASQWGILTFIREQGETPIVENLVTELPPQASRDSEMIQFQIHETLCDGNRLYLAASARPKAENTLVVPYVVNIREAGSMAVMDNPAYDPELSVVEYAQAHGYEHVITLSLYQQILSSSPACEDVITGLEYAAYDHLEDGTLRMILQYGYDIDEAFGYPERMDFVSMDVIARKYSAAQQWNPTEAVNEHLTVQADMLLYVSGETRRSIPEDAHDIVGYRGAIEYVALTPYDDERVAVSIMMDMEKLDSDQLWMSGPLYVLLDEEGNRLCEVTLNFSYNVFAGEGEPRLYHGFIPAQFMQQEKLTLRLENWNNSGIVYDQYTYTLK